MSRSVPHPLVPMAPRAVLVACATVAATTAIAAGCSRPGDDETSAPTGCAATIEQAAWAQDVDEQIDLLDTAILACRSYEAFETEIGRHPGIIGFDAETFVTQRCERVDDEALRASPTCEEVVTPSTTAPPTTLVALVWEGTTLDGRTIQLRPGADVEFVGEVPAVVQQNVDIAFESGCEGLVEQRDLWASYVDDSRSGQIASVYAQHAENVALYIGCDIDPFVPPDS